MLITFFFRYQIANKIQTGVLENIDGPALSSNVHFSAGNGLYCNHKICSLRGVEKILPHRVNSMERFQYLYSDFKGFECDIILADNHLYVAHNPEDISPLTWDHLLEKDDQEKIFWLDVKNLGVENVELFCRYINLLNNKYNLKDRIIIESGNPVPLKQIADSGYLTSLYFPVNNSSNTLDSDSSVSLYIANTSGLISQDVFWLNLMNKSYPEKKKIIWDISFYTSLNTDILKKYIADTTVLLCLINIKSPGYK
jgi:hypothetical protein